VLAGVAANHPATAEVGLRILSAGGTAADAAVAATFACCVAESAVTGLGGGGFATYYDAGSRRVTSLDFFCTYPGLGATREARPMRTLDVTFGPLPQTYAIGGASVGVPGIVAGLAAVHGRWGRLGWQRVVTPAALLARVGVTMPTGLAHTLRAVGPAMLPGIGAGIYAPRGRFLEGGELLRHPDLDATLMTLADHGPDEFYTGKIGELTVDAVQADGGILTSEDMRTYRVVERPIATARFAGHRVHGRTDLHRTIGTIDALPELTTLPPGPRAVAIAQTLRGYAREKLGDTSNVSVVDAAGNACVITLTLGLGSGVWVPGTGMHLNSMLGEGELRIGSPVAGRRVPSMMCPLVVTNDDGRLVLAIGSAGASRIRSALVQSLVGVLVDGRTTAEAIARRRFHVVDAGSVHAEPGFMAAEVGALEQAGYAVTTWPERDAYFGCVSGVGTAGAGADPRRGGVGVLL
jgi:gamma-glutamyltranspeptidase / glutathione hydrolase